jgi:tetratricopeptide (TPR) repeat protein
LPLWLEEGLAEFFSTFRIRRGQIDLGRPISTHIRHLRTGPPLNLEEVLGGSGAGGDDDGPPWPESRYAEAWALVHYLLAGRPGGWTTLGPLLEHLETGASSREALTAATGQSIETLQRDARFSVLGRGFPTIALTIGEFQIPRLSSPRELPYPLLLTHLAELLLAAGSPHLEQATLMLEYAADQTPGHPFPVTVRAAAHLARGDRIQARADLERALILRPGDPHATVLLGELLLEELPIVQAPRARGPAADAQRALALFTTVLAQAPLDPRVLEGYGRCFLHLDQDPAPGIAALRQALQSSPRRVKALLALILLLARTSQQQEAQELAAGPLQRLGSPEARRHAADALVLAELARVNPLLAERRVDEALVILESAGDRASSQHLRDQVARELEAVRLHRTVIRDEDAFNEIAAMVNSGAYDHALTRLEAVLPEFTTEQIRRQALVLRDRLRRLTRDSSEGTPRREP